jgi:HEAT repeat protein
VRQTAIQTVILFGQPARKAGKALIRELDDADPDLRVNAAIALGAIGLDGDDLDKGVKRLGKALTQDRESIVRLQAAAALGHFGTSAKAAIPQLVMAVKDTYTSFTIRKTAAMALGAVAIDRKEGPDPAAVSGLMLALNDPAAAVRHEALRALITLGAPSQADLKRREKTALERLLHDNDKLMVLWSRMALMRIDKVSEYHLRYIAGLLQDRDPLVRANAAQALGVVGAEAKAHVGELAAALKDKEGVVVLAAVVALGVMREHAQAAVPALTRLTEDKNEVLSKAAQQAIDQITGKAAKPKAP